MSLSIHIQLKWEQRQKIMKKKSVPDDIKKIWVWIRTLTGCSKRCTNALKKAKIKVGLKINFMSY